MDTFSRLDYFLKRPDIYRPGKRPWVFSSDTHRNCGDKSDDFKKNVPTWLKAMQYYFAEGFVLCEPGDQDDIWECKEYPLIQQAHPEIFAMLRKYDEQDRYEPVAGNHNLELGHPEALVLERGDFRALVVHGHQGDFWNDSYWQFGKWFTRNVWRKLQWLGFKDPTSARQEKNPRKHRTTRSVMTEWTNTRQTVLIWGHTHLQEHTGGYSWNCGSGVGNGIECIELWPDNSLHLVRWNVRGKRIEV